MRDSILDVSHVLIPPLDLEGMDPGLDQRVQIGTLVVIFHREQMLVIGHNTPPRVFQRVGQPTGLRTLAAIGAAPGVGLADVALAAEGNA